ncbi:metallophosphoesterase [Achromobacter arsenitoxydans]|uniref:Putative membrane-attached phosphoesterase n=1 Tax=Achromobacter arsenitoxydans SY8 TaxID=477184 RepID=H0FC23_9BURK|nr:metallophosphoesterase [Achromobacter arsenitoxydans]EHK64155.1 putative membrane-attached phosphoesterase [Achromobacter arsenitoxydans SY8]
MFHVIAGLIALYVIWRFVRPLKWPAAAKMLLAALLLLAAEHHLITRNFFGTMASPEVPGPVLMTLGWAFGALILLAIFLFVTDLAGLALSAFSRSRGRALLSCARLRAGLACAAVALSALGVWQAVRVPDVKTIEVALPGLPRAYDGFRIVHLTDLHASRLLQADWMRAVVSKTNALNPDLTLITGDLVDGTPEARANDVLPLRDLRAPHGVVAIPGNHEYYADYVGWLKAFEQLGLRMLLNEHITIERDGQPLVLAGITDSAAARGGQPLPDIAAAMAGVPPSASVILLSHRPVGAAKHAKAGADLQLSGHTHGGQILGPHLLTQLANEGYVSGMYQVDGMQLYVSNGAGLWPGFPIRLGRPSEITQIVLRAG